MLSPLDLRTRARRALLLGRGAISTRLLTSTTPKGLFALVRARLAGPLGPPALFRVHAVNWPERVALVGVDAQGKPIRRTYREVDGRMDALARALAERGLGKGDAAVLLLHNRPEFVEAQVAMARLGGSAVSASHRSTPAELRYLVEHSGARAIFADVDVLPTVRQALPHLPTLAPERVIVVGDPDTAKDGEAAVDASFVSFDALLAKHGHAPQVGATRLVEGSEESAVVIYTSGTTGKPKGAVRRFSRETAAAVLGFLAETPIQAGDRHLVVCPLYHATAFGFLGFNIVVGGTSVILPRFEPETFLQWIERERITTTAVVPTMLHRLMQLPERTLERYDTSTLRAVFSGGAPLSGTLARRFIERFGPILYNFYGSTETGINTLATPEELLRSPGTIGHVVPGNEIRLLDDEGRPVEPGQTGELWVKNDMLVAGYHRDDAATRDSMRDGFFTVGDLAHVDGQGLLHIDGRKRDLIISGGVNVYPAEVEEVLHAHPAVAEAAVVGRADEDWGERVLAFVALRPGSHVTAEELIAHCRRVLAGPKVPREVRFLEELPKNPTGKVLKRELRVL
jgi:fatty-acyl-CoA synthase